MSTNFKSVRLQPGQTWSAIITTREGADFKVGGFVTIGDAQAWIARETGIRFCAVSNAEPHTVRLDFQEEAA